MIDTIEKRRSAIDFGKGPRGAGMPVPSGVIDAAARSHALNLYPGIAPSASFFFFWRERLIETAGMQERVAASSTWQSSGDAEDGGFINPGTAVDE